jgi:hypothetical protein
MKLHYPTLCIKDHLLAGHPITILEAAVLFGSNNLGARIRALRDQGMLIERKRVFLSTVYKRMKPYVKTLPATRKAADSVPLYCTEYRFAGRAPRT